MKTLSLALFSAIMAIANFCSAQTALYVKDSTVSIGGDTLNLNSTRIINFEIVNSSPVFGYTGNLTAEIYNDSTGAGGFGNLIPINSVYIQAATINASGSIFVIDSFIVSPSVFRSGINTVVIWPRTEASSGFTTLDSTRHSVFVVNELTNKEIIRLEKIIVYPNPFSSKIWFTGLYKNNIEQVRILDVLGNEILSINLNEKTALDLSELSKGIYFIKLQSKDGKQIIIKTIKE